MTNPTGPLHGKAALVTGCSRGIGGAIARELASQGATVALTYSSSEAKANQVIVEINKAGGTALALRADQANKNEVVELVSTVIGRLGKLDIIVNNAAVFWGGMIDEAVDTIRFE